MLTLLSEIVEDVGASKSRAPAAAGTRGAPPPQTLEEGLSRALESGHRILRIPAPGEPARPVVVVPEVTPEVRAAVDAASGVCAGPRPVVVSAEVGDLLDACLMIPAGSKEGSAGTGAGHGGSGNGNGNGNGAGALEAEAAPSRSDRALKAAFHLREGGFGSEAVVQASRAILAALADLLARNGVPVPPDPQVAAAVRRHLVPSGRVPRALLDRSLSTLAWAQGFELDEPLPPSLADELLGEVSGAVGALKQA